MREVFQSLQFFITQNVQCGHCLSVWGGGDKTASQAMANGLSGARGPPAHNLVAQLGLAKRAGRETAFILISSVFFKSFFGEGTCMEWP